MSEKPKFSLFSWIFEYTSSDPDYIPVRKQKKNKRQIPLTLKQRIKRILIFVGVIVTFYLLLCAYILMNPSDAQFFNNIFDLEYVVIEFALEYTIYIFFGVIGSALLFFFIFFFYRGLAIKTKETARKWIVRGIAVLFGFLFFGNLATFAAVYNHFQAINFENLQGRIIVYDNTLFKYLDIESKSSSRLDVSKSLIGPVVLRFDLSGYMQGAEYRDGLSLSQPYEFFVDYENDEEYDYPTGRVNLTLPPHHADSARIIMRIDEPGIYQPVGKIEGTDVAGDPIELQIPFPEIRVDQVIEVTPYEQESGGYKYTFDGGNLVDFGVLNWRITSIEEDKHRGYIYNPDHIFTDIDVVCMRISEWTGPVDNRCDWRYVTEDAEPFNITGDLIARIDPVDRFRYQFELENLEFEQGALRQITWYIGDLEYVGNFPSGTTRILDYTFKNGGNHVVTAEVEDTTGRVRNFEILAEIGQYVELKDDFTIEVVDEEGVNIADGAYDYRTDTYIIEDIPVPHVLKLDGSKVRADSVRLRLTKVEWDLDRDGEYESEQQKIDFDMPVPGRYDFQVRYTFEDITVAGEVEELTRVERVSVIGVQKNLDVRVRITRDSEYAPSKVTFDASGSKTVDGEIAKFLYDFGDGNEEEFEGEGVINYLYEEWGEYDVTVTAVKTDGERASRDYIVIVKKPQEVAKINTSIASGRVVAGKPVTFDAVGSLWDVDTMTWNFGDQTPKRTGTNLTHIYKNPGTYTVSLSIKYESGVIEEAEKILVVIGG